MKTNLCLGDTISFSAGSQSLSPQAFRVVRSDKNRLVEAATHYPILAGFLSTQRLMSINCYPATLGYFPNTVFVDTYLRGKNFSRAMLLAHEEGFAACILGQPLLVTDFLQRHTEQGLAFPKAVLIGLGGYYCPLSLEQYIKEIFSKKEVQSMTFHAYGMAEADFACLLGQRQTMESQAIPYKTITSHVKAECHEGLLSLLVEDGERTTAFSTGDRAWEEGGFLHIQNGEERLSSETKAYLESWGHREWSRYTGYLRREGDAFVVQLREGATPEVGHEMSFYVFCERYAMDWAEKPIWK
jgi:hypothetical protein